jgi:transcriptional regulator with XRE-family HTH domain
MEIAIVARAKQGYIYRYLREHNLSVKELGRKIGVNQVTMSRIINFKWVPYLSGRGSSGSVETAKKLERFFHLPIDQLFPPELTKEMFKKLSRDFCKIEEIEMLSLDGVGQKYLVYDNEETPDPTDAIRNILAGLAPREEKVLRLIFGLKGDRHDAGRA